MPKDLQFINKLLHLLHSSPKDGHSGVDKTLYKVRRNFFWPRLKRSMKEFVRGCDICQRVKVEQSLPSGLFQPLPVPKKPWSDISMNFIEGLLVSKGHSMIWVVVDRFTKYSHFVSLAILTQLKLLLSFSYNISSNFMGFLKPLFQIEIQCL